MSTTTTTPPPSPESLWQDALSETGDSRAQRGKPDWTDIVFFLLLAVGAGFALTRYGHAMDYYECRCWPGWAGCGVRCAT